MMEDKLRLGFHSIIVACYAIGSVWALFICDFTPATDERVLDMQRYGGRYFTTWNFLFQLIYFGIALNEDIMLIKKSCHSCLKPISNVKGYLFTCFVVPCSTYVFTVFWLVFNYDRELVFPLATDQVVPLWFNHLVHTMTFVFMVLEFYFTERNTIPSLESAVIGFSLLNVIYYSIFFYTKSKSGRYFYDMFHLLSSWQLVIFILGTYLFCLFIIRGAMSMHKMIQKRKCKPLKKININEFQEK